VNQGNEVEQNPKIRFATVCSGIGAPEVAAMSLQDWECVFSSDIEAYPNAVSAAHWPGVPNMGDMTRFEAWPPRCDCKECERGQGQSHQDANMGHPHLIPSRMAVRRLTPRECERLQGFPDDFTLIKFRGKPAADGPRYKALGNSMAVPNIRWILRRIEMVNALVLAGAGTPHSNSLPSEGREDRKLA
jgi:site-specific DNA-cytosine methylase